MSYANYYALLERARQMNASVRICQAMESDAGSLVALMNKYYARKKEASYFLWQYFSNIQSAKMFIAVLGNEVIGMYGVQIRTTRFGPCGFLLDLVVDERFRGSGLALLLDDAILRYVTAWPVSFCATFTNKAGMMIRDQKFGWSVIAQIPQLEIHLLKLDPTKRVILSVFDRMTVKEAQLNSFIMDASFRRWRFDGNPLYRYEYIKLHEDDFSIIKIFIDPTSGESYGDIVAVRYEKGTSRQGLLELILLTCDHFGKKGVETVTTWALPHTNLYPLFRSIGFEEIIKERYFCVKILDSKYEFLYQIAHWDLAQADTEVY